MSASVRFTAKNASKILFQHQKQVLLSTSSTFYEQLLRRYSFTKKLQSKTVIREKLQEALSYKKVKFKMLMKLTPI